MRNTKTNTQICSICDKEMRAIITQDELSRMPYLADFKDDTHLRCRIKCAKYGHVGLKLRWLSTEPYKITNGNRMAFNFMETIKDMGYEQMRNNGVYLYGPPGTGKTHLLAYLCRYLVDRGFSLDRIKWANTSSILTSIRSSIGKKYDYEEETEQERTLASLKKPYLFLDDLGTESSTEWSKEILYEIINFRYEEKLPTFISSNLSPQELAERLGDKFASRIVEMCKPTRIEGDDWRLQKSDTEPQNGEEKIKVIPVFTSDMTYWDLELNEKLK